MKQIALSLIALAFIPFCTHAQQPEEPERLLPKELTSLSTVDEALHPEDSVAFYAIQNGNSLIGYLMEPKDDFISGLVLGFTLREKGDHALRGITLKELQRAEQQMVDILNAIVDSAQEVHRCFTPPRFYDHGRQYLFYTDTLGHRCMFVAFYDYDEDESLRRPLSVCDGDDGFWQAKFDLTEQRLKWFDVNGPTIYSVPGRSKEPRGLLRQSRFYYWDFELKYENIDEEELPEGAKTFCDQRLTKNLRRRSDGIYLYDIHNGPTAYFDKDGNFLALQSNYWNEKGIDLDEYLATLMPCRKTIMDKIREDMYLKNSIENFSLFKVERIKDKWLIGVTAGGAGNRICTTYYTFDDKGQLIGVDRKL